MGLLRSALQRSRTAAVTDDVISNATAELKALVQKHRDTLPPARVDGMLRIFSDCAGLGTECLALFLAGFGSGCKLVSVGGSEIDPVKRALLAAVHKCCHIDHHEDWFDEDVCTRDPFKCQESDVYVSGFPCPSWSRLGKRKKLQDGKGRGLSIFGCLRYLCARRPAVAVFENVAEFEQKSNAKALNIFNKSLTGMGYISSRQTLNTKHHGVPQSRPRMFFVAIHKSRLGKAFVFPTEIPCPDLHHFLQKDICGDVVLDLPQYEPLVPKEQLFGLGYIVDAGCSAKFANVRKNCSPCLIRSRCLQRKYYIPKLRRFLLPQEISRLQGFLQELHVRLVEALARKFPKRGQDRIENLVAGAMGDSMSCNVLMRVLCRAVMSAGLWPKTGCLQQDPWFEASKAKSHYFVSDVLFARASKRAKDSKRKAITQGPETSKRSKT